MYLKWSFRWKWDENGQKINVTLLKQNPQLSFIIIIISNYPNCNRLYALCAIPFHSSLILTRSFSVYVRFVYFVSNSLNCIRLCADKSSDNQATSLEMEMKYIYCINLMVWTSSIRSNIVNFYFHLIVALDGPRQRFIHTEYLHRKKKPIRAWNDNT